MKIQYLNFNIGPKDTGSACDLDENFVSVSLQTVSGLGCPDRSNHRRLGLRCAALLPPCLDTPCLDKRWRRKLKKRQDIICLERS